LLKFCSPHSFSLSRVSFLNGSFVQFWAHMIFLRHNQNLPLKKNSILIKTRRSAATSRPPPSCYPFTQTLPSTSVVVAVARAVVVVVAVAGAVAVAVVVAGGVVAVVLAVAVAVAVVVAVAVGRGGGSGSDGGIDGGSSCGGGRQQQ
jgi:uncharacterized membrane protein YgcG